MATLDSLLPLVRPFVDGCDELIMLRQIRWALREFTRKSRFLRESIKFDTFKDEGYYPLLSTIPDTEVISVDAVTFNGRPLAPTGPKEAPLYLPASYDGSEYPDDPNDESVQTYNPYGPTSYWFEPPATLVFSQVPDQDREQAGAVSLILTHTANTNTIAPAVAREYSDAVSYGALYRLLTMPKQSWTDPQMAAIYRNDFQTEIVNASSKASKSHRNRNYRVKPTR